MSSKITLPELNLSKLQDDDYPTWSAFMTRYLECKGLLDVCRKPDLKPDEESLSNAAMVIIQVSLDKQVRRQTSHCQTAYELWKQVKEISQGTVQDAKNTAMNRFHELIYRKGEKLSEFLSRYKEVLERYISTGNELDEGFKIHRLKMLLPERHRNVALMWSAANDRAITKGKVQDLISFLKTNDISSEEDRATALFSNTKQGKAKKKLEDIECYGCREKGHYQNKCPKRKMDDKRKKHFAKQNQHRTINSRPSFLNETGEVAHMAVVEDKEVQTEDIDDGVKKEIVSDDEPVLVFEKQPKLRTKKQTIVERFLTKNEGEPESWQINQPVGKYKRCADDIHQQETRKNEKIDQNNLVEQARFAERYSSRKINSERREWIVDSGASKHMTPYRELITDYKRLEKDIPVTLGSRAFAVYGLGQGDIHTKSGILKNVLWVPKISQNLFSVPATTQVGNDVIFSKDVVRITKDGEIKLEAKTKMGRLMTIILEPPEEQEDMANESSEEALIALPIEIWHRKFGHMNDEEIKEMARKKMVKNLEISKSRVQTCLDCMLGKTCRVPHQTRTTIRGTSDAAVVHFDTSGPLKPTSLGGSKYMVLGIEEFTSYIKVGFLSSKIGVANLVKNMVTTIELESKRRVKMICTDQGTEYINEKLDEWLKEQAIVHSVSVVYTPQQNGFAERAIRSIKDMARTILCESKLPEELWAEACQTAACYMNRRPEPRSRDMTRYEKYWGKKPDARLMKIFGEKCCVLQQERSRDTNWSPKGKMMFWVGFGGRTNIHRIYDDTHNVVFEECNVRFMNNYIDTLQVSQGTISTDLTNDEDDDIIIREPTSRGVQFSNNMLNSSGETTIVYEESDLNKTDESVISGRDPLNDAIHEEIQNRAGTSHSFTSSLSSLFRPVFARNNDSSQDSIQGSYRQTEQADLVIADEDKRELALFTIDDEPLNLREAKSRPEWEEWRAAMNEEMRALKNNNTWVEVDRSKMPSHAKTIKNKWVFKNKYLPDGSISRRKARLVAKGYSQIPNIDYKETFAPVASMNTIRTVFAIAAQRNWELAQFDVKTAFLHGDIDEELYMECPEGYEKSSAIVCKLQKSLYGLKQAPRQWNVKFGTFLTNFKLKQSKIDKCVYFNEDETILLTIYVDDGLVAAKNMKLINCLIDYLRSNLEITIMNECRQFLGFEVFRDRVTGTIDLQQASYIYKLLEKFNMLECNPINTPEEIGGLDRSAEKLDEKVPFKELVGSLLYLVTCTRPDIAHAVSIAARTAEPTTAHWKMLKRILRYLKGTQELGIRFRREDTPRLEAYSDADYANDVVTRKSTTGFAIFYSGPLAWRCQRQTIVALSTTEAEYIAACDLVKELLPLREMLSEIGEINQTIPTTIKVDNRNAILIAKGEGGQQRTKYIDVREKWLEEQVKNNNISIEHVPGELQTADMLTKALPATKFVFNRRKLMNRYVEAKERRENSQRAISGTNSRKISSIMNSMWLFLILHLCIAAVESYEFDRANPIHYVRSSKTLVNTNKQVDLRVLFLNPCETYFKEITGDVIINKQLIDGCNTAYERNVKSPLKKCNIIDPPKITKVAKGLMSTNAIGKRNKRSLGAVVKIMFYFIVAGLEVLNIAKTEVNEQNIHTLNELIGKDERKIGYEALGTLKNAILDLDERLKKVETNLTYLNTTMREFPMIISLVQSYETIFNTYHDILLEVDEQYGQDIPRMSRRLGKFLYRKNNEIWQEEAVDYGQVQTCFYKNALGNSLELVYEVIFPVIDKTSIIYKQSAFRYWNETKKDYFCWMKYSGPRYVLVNTTANCFLEIQEFWFNEDILSGYKCEKPSEDMKYNGTLYKEDFCEKSIKNYDLFVQKKQIDGVWRIYCFGFKISIRLQDFMCPNFVFELPLTESWYLEGFEYRGISESKITIDTFEMNINKQIGKRLKHLKRETIFPEEGKMEKILRGFEKTVGTIKSSTSIKLKEMPSLMSPIETARSQINRFVDFLEEGLLFMAGIAVLATILLLMPVATSLKEILASLIGFIKEIINWLTSTLRKTKRRKRNRYNVFEIDEIQHFS